MRHWNIWPFNEFKRLEGEIDNLRENYRAIASRDLETERVISLQKQAAVLGDKAKDHDRMCADLRKLRATVRDLYQGDLEQAEAVGTPLVDLVIWIMRGKPGPRASTPVKTSWNPEQYKWSTTGVKYIWRCDDIGCYHFQNEAEQIDETPYNTMVECEAALKEYARTL